MHVVKMHVPAAYFPVFSPLLLLSHSELLSPQQHYDWGLRALKTVLKGSGFLLQHEKEMHHDEPSQ